MAKEFVIKHGLIVHGEITGSDIRIDDWNSVSASLSELSSNVGETVTTASISGNVITFTKSDGTTFETVVQEDTGSFFTSASVDYNRVTFTQGDGTTSTITIDTGSFEPDRQDTGSFFTSASVDLNTITFHYGASGSSGSLTVDTGSNFISNVVLDPSPTGSSLIFTGEGGAFNGAVDMSRAYQQGGGMTLNYSGSVLFNAASEWTGGNPNRKVSSTVTSMRDSGWNEWRFSDISRNFSSQYHNNSYNESVFDLITSVVNHTGQLIVRVYDDRNSAYEGFYMNSGSATIKNNAGGAGDLSLYLKHIGGRGWGATSATPGNNTINNTNVAFSFTGTQLYESGSQSQSAFNEASVTSNVVTLTRDDGTREILNIDTGSAVTTDISALNTFTGSIQTEVDDLKAATGSYYLSSSNSQATLRLFQADGTSVTHDLFNPNTYVSSSVDSNRITFTQKDGSTEVVTVDTGSKATPAGSNTELQFNDNGAFGATTGITYSSSPQMLALDSTSILVEGKSVPIQLTEGSSASKQTVISYAQSTTSNVGFRVGNNDLGNTGRDIFVIAHGTTNFAASNTTNIFELDQAGSLIMSAYGSGTNTGNPGYYLAVDSTGRIVEELITTGSGGGGTIDTGSFYVDSSVNLNTITFTKGDGLTEVITVDTGSGLTGNGSVGQIALWDASKRLNGDGHFVWNPLNNRMGINIASPESQIHIDGYGQPIRLTSTSNTQMYIRYQNQNSTSEGMRVGNDSTSPYGGDNFVVQWDSGNPSANSWEEIFRVSGSGETFMVGLDNATTSNTLYYNSSTGEVSYGAAPSGGGGGTVDTGSFYVGSSVNLNTITFTQGDGTTESVTIDTGSASGGGGSGTVNTGVAGYLAYYPSNGTTVDDQTGLYWDSANNRLGLGTTSPLRAFEIQDQGVIPVRLESSTDNAQLIQLFGANSTGAGIRVGTIGINDFTVQQSEATVNVVNTNLYVSESGETYLPRLAADATPSDIVYYDSLSGELSYGSAPSGGGTDTTIYSTNGTLSGNRTLTGNGNSLALSGITTLNLDGDLTQIRGQIYIAESTNSQVSITNATKSDILYFDSTTGEVTYGSAPSGGGGGSIDGTGVANKLAIWSDADTLTNDTNLHWDSSLDRLGIGVAAPTATVHVGSTSSVPVWLDGLDNSQTSQFIRMSVTGGSNNGLRIGNDGADSFKVQKHNGSSWDTRLEVQDGGEVFAESLGTATSANTLYYNTTTGEITYGAAPSGGSGETYDLNVTQASTSVILNLDSTSGTDDSSVQLDAGTGITLTQNASSRFTIASSGGGGTPGGATNDLQFNNASSFDGTSDFTYESSNSRFDHRRTDAQPIIRKIFDASGTSVGRSATLAQYSFRLENMSGVSNGDLARIEVKTLSADNPATVTTANRPGMIEFATTTENSSGTRTVGLTVGQGRATVPELKVGGTAHGTNTIAKLEVLSAQSNGISLSTTGHIVSATGAHIGSATAPTSGKLQVTGNTSGVSIYASHDIVAYSDARSKVNIETIPDALEKVNAVRGVTYNKVDDPEGMRYMGVIAQELLEHLPEVVHQGEEGNYSVAYGNVVGVLIEAVKELTAKVEDLESRLGK